MKKTRVKYTKKLEQERIEFNKKYRKSQTPLTIEQYYNYVMGKGLPDTQTKKSRAKPLKPIQLPNWAVDPYQYPSAQTTGHIAVKNSIMERLDKESEEVRQEILAKKNRIAIPYSKGAYQYVSDSTLTPGLGRKL